MLLRATLKQNTQTTRVLGLVVLVSLVFIFRSMRGLQEVSPVIVQDTLASRTSASTSKASENFLYFAYASDLLESRLKAGGGPSAKLIGIGRVKGMKFAFSQESKVWRGGVADMIPSTNEEDEVWGAVYRLKAADLIGLNKQKGTNKEDPLYEQIYVKVEMSDKVVSAISFGIVDHKRLSYGAAPSPQYKECLVRGAEELGLPDEYIETLRVTKDNGSTYRRKNTC